MWWVPSTEILTSVTNNLFFFLSEAQTHISTAYLSEWTEAANNQGIYSGNTYTIMEADFRSSCIKRNPNNLAQLILHTTAILSLDDLLWLSLLFLCIYLFLLKESTNFILSLVPFTVGWLGWRSRPSFFGSLLTVQAFPPDRYWEYWQL